MPASRARIMARTGSLSRPRKALRRERQRGLRQWRGAPTISPSWVARMSWRPYRLAYGVSSWSTGA
jgi:hypothetical protein